ncbi:MAG: NlpC/P60 family protein, partial [Acidobacteria bacterium]|nr:NlpC/P60 family protein [Acidobacteriota bacterium]
MRLHRPFFALLFVVLALAFPVASGQDKAPAVVPGIDDILKPLRDRVAPDRRLAVFDITVERGAQGLVVKGEVERADIKQDVLAALGKAGHSPLTDQIAVLPDPALGLSTAGIVRVSVANVKTRSSHPSEMGTQAVMGWTVRILKKQSGWYYVHTEPDQYLGWIEELQLAQVTEDARKAWTSAPRVIVTNPIAFVREAMTADATPVTDVVMGSLVKRLAQEGAWLKVELPDGRQGFLPAGDAADYAAWAASRQPTPDGIEKTAKQFMGVPYLWGGTSSKGFDCSGYAKTVLRMNGLELARDADQQGNEGTAVTIDEALSHVRKGDLLFFGTRATAD